MFPYYPECIAHLDNGHFSLERPLEVVEAYDVQGVPPKKCFCGYMTRDEARADHGSHAADVLIAVPQVFAEPQNLMDEPIPVEVQGQLPPVLAADSHPTPQHEVPPQAGGADEPRSDSEVTHSTSLCVTPAAEELRRDSSPAARPRVLEEEPSQAAATVVETTVTTRTTRVMQAYFASRDIRVAEGTVAPAVGALVAQAGCEAREREAQDREAQQDIRVVHSFTRGGVSVPNDVMPPGDYLVYRLEGGVRADVPQRLRVLPPSGRGCARGGHTALEPRSGRH